MACAATTPGSGRWMPDPNKENRGMFVEDGHALRDRPGRDPEWCGFDMRVASGLAKAMGRADAALSDDAVVDPRLRDRRGLSLVEMPEKRAPGIRAVILTRYATSQTAVVAVRMARTSGATPRLVRGCNQRSAAGPALSLLAQRFGAAATAQHGSGR